jgi:hypothetical protein
MRLHAIIIGEKAKVPLHYVDTAHAIEKFKIVRTCPPCRYLSRLLDADIMKWLKYIGGYRATIVQSGTISVNDKIIY